MKFHGRAFFICSSFDFFNSPRYNCREENGRRLSKKNAPDGGEILNKNICKKTSGLLFAAIFLLSGGVLAGCGGGESESEEIISCYLDFINPETGEYLAKPHGWDYKDCYLTYDGTEKTLDYVVRNIYIPMK